MSRHQRIMERREASGSLQAHTAVARAIRHGQLPRPATLGCADCGLAADRYDHRDYAKPLDVQAVCRRCNFKRGPALFNPAKAAA